VVVDDIQDHLNTILVKPALKPIVKGPRLHKGSRRGKRLFLKDIDICNAWSGISRLKPCVRMSAALFDWENIWYFVHQQVT
jgi:hypothetical protein